MEIINLTGIIGNTGGLSLAWSSKVTITIVNKTESQSNVIVNCNFSDLVWMLSGTYRRLYRIRKHVSREYSKT